MSGGLVGYTWGETSQGGLFDPNILSAQIVHFVTPRTACPGHLRQELLETMIEHWRCHGIPSITANIWMEHTETAHQLEVSGFQHVGEWLTRLIDADVDQVNQHRDAVVRPAAIADLPVIEELWWQESEYYRHLGISHAPIVTEQARELMRADLARSFHLSNRLLLVAEREGGVIGYIRGDVMHNPMHAPEQYGYLFGCTVNQAARGGGVAPVLVAETLRWMVKRGVRRVQTARLVGNAASHRILAKMGFRPTRKVYSLLLVREGSVGK